MACMFQDEGHIIHNLPSKTPNDFNNVKIKDGDIDNATIDNNNNSNKNNINANNSINIDNNNNSNNDNINNNNIDDKINKSKNHFNEDDDNEDQKHIDTNLILGGSSSKSWKENSRNASEQKRPASIMQDGDKSMHVSDFNLNENHHVQECTEKVFTNKEKKLVTDDNIVKIENNTSHSETDNNNSVEVQNMNYNCLPGAATPLPTTTTTTTTTLPTTTNTKALAQMPSLQDQPVSACIDVVENGVVNNASFNENANLSNKNYGVDITNDVFINEHKGCNVNGFNKSKVEFYNKRDLKIRLDDALNNKNNICYSSTNVKNSKSSYNYSSHSNHGSHNHSGDNNHNTYSSSGSNKYDRNNNHLSLVINSKQFSESSDNSNINCSSINTNVKNTVRNLNDTNISCNIKSNNKVMIDKDDDEKYLKQQNMQHSTPTLTPTSTSTPTLTLTLTSPSTSTSRTRTDDYYCQLCHSSFPTLLHFVEHRKYACARRSTTITSTPNINIGSTTTSITSTINNINNNINNNQTTPPSQNAAQQKYINSYNKPSPRIEPLCL
ncbi:hypothetical protein HELRODRAFT_168071 [Helobdella robusta]|uniref:Uncharacterized protein n=1 Tax=Helobdella robusta TaxID=6412 RepID=T1F049_HELRO|nr:hypothetical protein HELRODRAFT_168071 [Helobdella robusta]ESO10195.1 hypothetical protein HELRODRAFT_168071 [Helobdella robusta]